jgi:hypothetical protein
MAVQTFVVSLDDCSGTVYKEPRTIGKKFYLTSGQGCRTIWFSSLKAAKEALKNDGVKTGKDLMDCSECGNHYSFHDERWKKLPVHACGEAKRQYALKFEK